MLCVFCRTIRVDCLVDAITVIRAEQWTLKHCVEREKCNRKHTHMTETSLLVSELGFFSNFEFFYVLPACFFPPSCQISTLCHDPSRIIHTHIVCPLVSGKDSMKRLRPLFLSLYGQTNWIWIRKIHVNAGAGVTLIHASRKTWQSGRKPACKILKEQNWIQPSFILSFIPVHTCAGPRIEPCGTPVLAATPAFDNLQTS